MELDWPGEGRDTVLDSSLSQGGHMEGRWLACGKHVAPVWGWGTWGWDVRMVLD